MKNITIESVILVFIFNGNVNDQIPIYRFSVSMKNLFFCVNTISHPFDGQKDNNLISLVYVDAINTEGLQGKKHYLALDKMLAIIILPTVNI